LSGRIWVSWERHRRNQELSRAFDAELFELTCDRPRLGRYVTLVARTIRLLIDRRPSILFVQCPSLVLALLAGALKRVFRYALVADLHNESVRPCITSFPGYEALLRLARWTADVCVVSNARLQQIVEETGGRASVLPDKVPDLGAWAARRADGSDAQVVFVCTYAADEPYCEVLEAARLLPASVTVHVTGSPAAARLPLPPSPARLTGFLSDAEYLDLLRSADVVIDLTSMEDCLVCGAYEAVALEKPLVTSDTAALRSYFSLGTVYTKHDARSLAAAVIDALARKDRLAAEMKILKQDLVQDWTTRRDALRRQLEPAAGTLAVSQA
jgi:glycosyltransferase involved in cell wall biosynthesis